MTGRIVRVAHGVSSLVAIVVLAVGVPVLLARIVGWPLPTKLPTVDEVSLATRSGIADSTVAKTIAVVAWIAWAQVAAALVAETAAVLRGRSAVKLPVLPGIQGLAARLVAGVLLLSVVLQPARALAAPQPLQIVRPEPVLITSPSTPITMVATIHAPASASQRTPSVSAPTVIVRRHDSYWAIAERTLGDGLRWQEIHRLNAGRTLDDGTVIPTDDTLHAGWQLVLPSDATVPPTTNLETATATPPEVHVVENGDNLWDIAETTVEDRVGHHPTAREVAPAWAEIIELNRDTYVEPGNPNLILPGQVIKLTSDPTNETPATDPSEEAPRSADTPTVAEADSTTTPPPTEPTASTTTTTTTTTTTEASTITTGTASTPATTSALTPTTAENDTQGERHGLAADTEDDDSDDSVPVAIGALSSIALAVGIRRLIARRRRRSATGHTTVRPNEAHRELHQLVVAQADEERVHDLRSIVAGLASALAESGSSRRPRIVRHTPSSVEVLLDQPDTHAPDGWTTSTDGRVWTSDDIGSIATAPGCAAPLLVTIGSPDDDAQLYVDLETDALWALTGDPAVARDAARSMVTELALAPLAESLRVIAVGQFVTGVDHLDHLAVVASWTDIEDDLRAWAHTSHEALREANWDNAFLARGVDPDNDVLAPLVIIADHPPSAELAAELLAARPGSFAVVAVGVFAGALTIECSTDTLHIAAVGISCGAQRLTDDELSDIAALVTEPNLIAVVEPAVRSGRAAQLELDITDGDPAEHTGPPAFDIIVRLLGDITVSGGKPLKPKGTSVVAYLALHRSVSTERLEEACWFGADGVSHRKRLRDTLTECRDAIGSQHLPPNRSGTYSAGPRLRTDLDLFDWHIDQASRVAATALDHYQAALELVAGKPFSYPNAARASFGWVDFEHHATTWEHRISGVAQAASALLVDAGRHDDAIVVLRQVVRAIPLNSAVVEALIRSHLAAGDDRGARAVYVEHADALQQAGLGEPADSVESLFAA